MARGLHLLFLLLRNAALGALEKKLARVLLQVEAAGAVLRGRPSDAQNVLLAERLLLAAARKRDALPDAQSIVCLLLLVVEQLNALA